MSEKYCSWENSGFLVSSSVFLGCPFEESEIFYLPRLLGFVSCGISPGTLGIWSQVNIRIFSLMLFARQADEKYTAKELVFKKKN